MVVSPVILNLKFKVETSNPNSFQSGTFEYLQILNCYFYVVCTVYIFENIGEFAHSLFSVMQRSEPRISPSNSCLENWPKPKIWIALRGHYVWILKKNWKFHPQISVKNFHQYEARLQKHSIFTDRKCAPSCLLVFLSVNRAKSWEK